MARLKVGDRVRYIRTIKDLSEPGEALIGKGEKGTVVYVAQQDFPTGDYYLDVKLDGHFAGIYPSHNTDVEPE